MRDVSDSAKIRSDMHAIAKWRGIRPGRLGAPALLVFVLTACDPASKSDSGPTAPPMSMPENLIGSYRSDAFWTGRALVAGLTLYEASCSGELEVSGQTGGNWTGTFAAGAPCPTAAGDVTGTVDGAGNVTLVYDGSGLDATPIGEVDCDVPLPADQKVRMQGMLVGTRLELSARFSVSCGTPPLAGTLELLAAGERQ